MKRKRLEKDEQVWREEEFPVRLRTEWNCNQNAYKSMSAVRECESE